MTIVIKRSDSKVVMKKKLAKLEIYSSTKKQKTFKELCGSLKGVFKEDALKLQRKWRDEWD
jgi:hypothetical protein